jgi:WD40 repeat protein
MSFLGSSLTDAGSLGRLSEELLERNVIGKLPCKEVVNLRVNRAYRKRLSEPRFWTQQYNIRQQYERERLNAAGIAPTVRQSLWPANGARENEQDFANQCLRLPTVLEGHTSGPGVGQVIQKAIYSPNGNYVVTLSTDAKLWNVSDNRVMHTLVHENTFKQRTEHEADHGNYTREFYFYDAGFSPDSTLLFTLSEDNTVKIWNVQEGTILQTLQGVEPGQPLEHQAFQAAVFVSYGTQLLTQQWIDRVELWDIETGKKIQNFGGNKNGLLGIKRAVSPIDPSVLTTSDSKAIELWEITYALIETHVIRAQGRVSGVAHSPDGLTVVISACLPVYFQNDAEKHPVPLYYRLTVQMWSTTGEFMRTFDTDALKDFDIDCNVSFSQNGKRIFGTAGRYPKHTILWETSTGRLLLELPPVRNAALNGLVSPSGLLILFPGPECSVLVIDTSTGATLQTLKGHTLGITSASFSPDGATVLTSSYDGTARLWPLDSNLAYQTLT